MDDLLGRLKRERLVAVILFIVCAAIIAAAQLVLAPEPNEVELVPVHAPARAEIDP